MSDVWDIRISPPFPRPFSSSLHYTANALE